MYIYIYIYVYIKFILQTYHCKLLEKHFLLEMKSTFLRAASIALGAVTEPRDAAQELSKALTGHVAWRKFNHHKWMHPFLVYICGI